MITVLSGPQNPSFLSASATGPQEAPGADGCGPGGLESERQKLVFVSLLLFAPLGLSPASCCVHHGEWGGQGWGWAGWSDSAPLFGRNSR